MENNTKKLLAIFVVIGLVVGAVVGFAVKPAGGLSQDQVNQQISDAVTKANAASSAQESTDKASLQSTIDSLNAKLSNTSIVPGTSLGGTGNVGNGYLFDKLSLDTPFSEILTNKQINLIRGQVSFLGDNYGVKEAVYLNNLTLLTNQKDFADKVYLSLPENSVEYDYILDSSLNLSKISANDPLQITFLGQPMSIISWNGDQATLLLGESHDMKAGDSFVSGDKTVTLVTTGDGYAYVSVGDIRQKVPEGSTVLINGLQVEAKNVIASHYSGDFSMATLIVGKDVESTVSNGDDYADNSIWSYVVGDHTIGIKLNTAFTQLNDIDGYNVLSDNGKFCLVNNYTCVQYNGLKTDVTDSYSFQLDNSVMIIRGKFVSGLDSYDRIYLNNSVFYSDRELTKVLTSVSLDGSNLPITADISGVHIDNVNLNLALSSVTVGTNSVAQDDNYITDLGIVIKQPNDSIKTNRFTLVIPEDKVEGSISLI